MYSSRHTQHKNTGNTQTLRIIRIILTTIIVESLCFYPFLKQKSCRGGLFSPAEGTANFWKLSLRRIWCTINENYKTIFFLFHFRCWNPWASYGISGDPVPVRMRDVRLLLQAGTSECLRKRGGKKRERAKRRASKRGREWMRVGEGGCCCRLKKERSCSERSHRKVLGLEEAQGSPASHWHLVCPSPTALSSAALSKFYWDDPTADLSTGLHQALLTHPKGLFSSAPPPPPPPLLFLLCSFSPEKKKKTPLLCSLK